MFKITPETPIKERDGVVIVSGPGGSPWVTDPKKPHLGGNFDGGDLGTMYPNDLWPWLIEEFKVKSMADIGCGTGETITWFRSHGCTGIGVDGLEFNVKRAPTPTILHDFCNGPVEIPKNFPTIDLVWCADVVEHIDEEFVGNILQALCLGRVLAMCQGTEEHENLGWHHVNNKPQQYWVDKLATIGMVEDVEMTQKSRELGNHGWWAETGRIYRRIDEVK